jgi:serine/threonine protein kinase
LSIPPAEPTGAADPTGAVEPVSDLANRVVAEKYILGATLGRGAMGEVYQAWHAVTGQPVALKLIHPHIAQHAVTGPRFLREARVTARVDHPGVVRVLDAGADRDGALFLVMELLEGETLRAALDRGRLNMIEALQIVSATLGALEAAHGAGIVHRDLKPDNIFLARTSDGGEVVKLLDFGIARELESASVTRTETAVGTPHYMAPEQAMSAKTVGPAADVWSVGVLLYRIVTGQLPFVGDGPYETVLRVCSVVHTPVSALVPEVPPALAALIEHCLMKLPEARVSSAASARHAIDGVLAGLGAEHVNRFDAAERRATVLSSPGVARRSSVPQASLDQDLAAWVGSEDPSLTPPRVDERAATPSTVTRPPTPSLPGATPRASTDPMLARSVAVAAPPSARGTWLALAGLAIVLAIAAFVASLSPDGGAPPRVEAVDLAPPSTGAERGASAAPVDAQGEAAQGEAAQGEGPEPSAALERATPRGDAPARAVARTGRAAPDAADEATVVLDAPLTEPPSTAPEAARAPEGTAAPRDEAATSEPARTPELPPLPSPSATPERSEPSPSPRASAAPAASPSSPPRVSPTPTRPPFLSF